MWILFYVNFLITFTISGLFCFYKDFKSNDEQLNNKIQSTNKLQVLSQYKFILPRVIINALGLIPFFFKFAMRLSTFNEDFNFMQSIFQIIFAGFFIDFFFYSTHRLLHHPKLYKWSHYIHHRFNKPVGIEAIYHHWFDLYFSNLLPIFLSLWILPNKNIITWHFWIFLSTSTAVIHSHSGWYQTRHSTHHTKYIVNYGVGLFMDKICGTQY